MRIRPTFTLATGALAALTLLGPAARLALAHEGHDEMYRYGTMRNPLTGEAYEKMRALAHHLDGRAGFAADKAAKRAHHGTPREKEFLRAIRDFAREAEAFHERMDRYADAPWVVPGELRDLDRRARLVNERIRKAHLFPEVYDDWDDALDMLNRMDRLLRGEVVQVPPSHPEWRVYDRDRVHRP